MSMKQCFMMSKGIFYILGIKKSDLDEVQKWWLSRRKAVRTHNQPSGRLKKAVEGHCDLIFCTLGIEKSDLEEVT
jgi:hypothetical protein